jgi:hypothetical protein
VCAVIQYLEREQQVDKFLANVFNKLVDQSCAGVSAKKFFQPSGEFRRYRRGRIDPFFVPKSWPVIWKKILSLLSSIMSNWNKHGCKTILKFT